MARTAKTTVATLQAENKRLQAENASLKKRLSGQSGSHRVWQKVGIVVCIALAGALLVAGNLMFWAGNSLVKEDRFVSATSPLIKQPEVQQGIALYATNQLYQNVDIEQQIQNALPPRAEFLAPPLSGQVRTATQTSLEKVLANEKFQDTWTNTITKAHARIINYVKNYQGNGTISLNDVYQNLSKQLEGTKLAFAANKTLPANVGSITLINAGWLPAAHNLVTNIDLYRFLAIIIVLAASALAIWLARNRRKMVVTLGIVYSFLMLISLLSIRVFQHVVPGKVASEYRPAAQTAVNVITHPLIIQTRTLLLLGILMVVIAWLTGPYRSARTLRGRIQILLEGRLHQALFAKENGFTRWMGNYKRVLQWLAVGIIVIIMLFLVQLSPKLVVLYGLLMLLVVLVIEFLAAPERS
jgi:hypothetical protein